MSDTYKAYSKSLYNNPPRQEAKRPSPPPKKQQMEVVRPTNPMGSF